MLSFIHLTDCHLLDRSSDTLRDINTYESLSRVIQYIIQQNHTFDFVLVTGDISQTGSESSYALFNELIHKLGKPIYCLPGNHDNPNFLKKFFPQTPNQAISVNLIQSHFLILLNSKVINSESGKLSSNQLQQLKNMLDRNSHRPVIVAVHHQPIKIDSDWMDNINLQNGEDFLAILEKYPLVKLMLFGHVHQDISTTHKHIQIFGTPSSCYQFKPKSQISSTDDSPPGYRVVKLLKDDTIENQVFRVSNISC